jgi:hypothetical protein
MKKHVVLFAVALSFVATAARSQIPVCCGTTDFQWFVRWFNSPEGQEQMRQFEEAAYIYRKMHDPIRANAEQGIASQVPAAAASGPVAIPLTAR